MKKYSLSLALLVALSFVGCGGGSVSTPTSSDPKITGDLGNSYAYYKPKWYENIITKAYASGYGQVKKAVAIPMLNGHVDITSAKEVTINSDGTFSAALPKKMEFEGESIEANWIVLLEKLNGTVKFLSIPNAAGTDSLLTFPMSKTISNINLGDIGSDGSDEGKSSINLSQVASKVTYNINDLTALASTDDVAKAVINQYKNNFGKSEDKHINVRLTVIAEGNFTKMATQYSKASDYIGYAINIQGSSNTVLKQNFNNICQNTKQIQLELPTNKSITFQNDNTYQILTSSGGTMNGTSCSSNGGIFQSQSDGDSVSLNFGGGNKIVNSLTVPTGNWTLKFDGNIIGNYNLAYSLPVENGQIKLPIPSVKLDLDPNDNNKTKGFFMKWYIGSTQIPNEIVTAIIPDATIYTQGNSGLALECSDAMLDNNGTLKSYISISDCKEGNTDNPALTRYYKPANGSSMKALESVYVRYETPGNEVRFSYDQ